MPHNHYTSSSQICMESLNMYILMGAGASLLPEGLLRSVDHVEEAIFILLPLEQLGHGHRDAGHRALVDEQEEGLVRVQLHPAPV